MTVGAVPHRYGYRRCRCQQCQTIGYHRPGRVTRLLMRDDVYSVSSWAFSWGYEFSWDHGRSVCLRCREVVPCKCKPIWALQAGLA